MLHLASECDTFMQAAAAVGMVSREDVSQAEQKARAAGQVLLHAAQSATPCMLKPS